MLPVSANRGLPSGKRLQFAIENGPVEIVDLPIKKMVVFRYVTVDQRAVHRLGRSGFDPP